MRLTGFAKVNVNIDETRARHEARAIDNFRLLFVGRRKTVYDDSVLHEEIADGIPLVGRINYTGIFDVKARHVLLGKSES